MFLNVDFLEAFYGGAAGGGKSDALLMSALQYVDVPSYSALILRRTFPDLSQPGAIMDRANLWLKDTNARRQNGGRSWLFPSGARLIFGHVQNYQEATTQFSSAEFQFIGIDELTQGWDERTYKFLLSRIRRPVLNCRVCRRRIEWRQESDRDELKAGEEVEPAGWYHIKPGWCQRPIPIDMPAAPDGTTLANVPLRIRTASNPGGTGHLWVKERFVDPETREPSAVFVPARLSDNPHLDQEAYESQLLLQGGVLTARLLGGDWDVLDEGLMFQRQWFDVVPSAPEGTEWLRYWDLATGTKAGRDDATAGALVGLHRESGHWYIADMKWLHLRPKGVEDSMVQTAAEDNVDGHVPVSYEQESGSSGVFVTERLQTLLAGHEFIPDKPMKAKAERARPVSSAAEAGRVHIVGTTVIDENELPKVVMPKWAKEFLDEVELFPMGPHDDQVDAVSGGFKVLWKNPRRAARAATMARRTLPGGRTGGGARPGAGGPGGRIGYGR